MKNLTDPGAGRRSYVDTGKPGNAEPADFSWPQRDLLNMG